MTSDEAIDYIHGHSEQLLQRDASGKGFICPICGDGNGTVGKNGMTTKDGIHFTCWRGCFTNADLIDIIGQRDGLTSSFTDRLKATCKEMGIELDPFPYRDNGLPTADGLPTAAAKPPAPATEPPKQAQGGQATAPDDDDETDYTEYFKRCHERLAQTDYPAQRGLSSAILERFNVGFDDAWVHPKNVKNGLHVPPTPRLIVPASRTSYLARDIRPDEKINEKQKGFVKQRVGHTHTFNLEALQDATQPTIIVEGEIDAMSVCEVGGSALGLASISRAGTLLTEIDELLADGHTIKQSIIINLDNDGKPQTEAMTQTLCAGLKKRGIIYYRRNVAGDYKDVNERLQHDREGLLEAVKATRSADEQDKAQYLATSCAAHLKGFLDDVAQSVNTPCISTGFESLDYELDGGLYEGLYIMGAISSLGKTAFVMQMADNIAADGHDVLVIALEMARSELMARSISRHTFNIAHELCYPDHANDTEANRISKTARGITDAKRYERYDADERRLIVDAIKAYGKYAKHIYISEGIGDIGVYEIRETVEQHIHFTGNTPVIIVDYLQILKPHDERATDKMNTDKSTMELKRISRDFKTPTIAISSFNRLNYANAVTMEAFKESGAIEYSSDVLLGLQLEGAGAKDFDATTEKRKDPRNIELVILKNRYGRVGERLPFKYYPAFNYFREVTSENPPQQSRNRSRKPKGAMSDGR